MGSIEDSPEDLRAYREALSAVPAMATDGREIRISVDGAVSMTDADGALLRLGERPHLVCHAVLLGSRLALMAGRRSAGAEQTLRHFDLAELFAFVMPAVGAAPLPSAMGAVPGLELSDTDPEDLRRLAAALLARIASPELHAPRQALELAVFLQGARWPWAGLVLKALEAGHGLSPSGYQRTGLEIWESLPEWEETGPQPPPGSQPVGADEARSELLRILGPAREKREAQMRYAAEVARAFAPRPSETENNVLLAEAGTGLGKTLGYLAPATVWARRNAGAVWISTYTKNLQRQLKEETRRIWPDPDRHRRRVAVRKGRENYMCLLNAQERFASFSASTPRGAALAALVARWALASSDGDMVGGDFPAWLMGLLVDGHPGAAQLTPMSLGLTDRRGECSYAACPHFRRCFIEKARVRSQRADIVIANHAVVLTQAAADLMLGERTGQGVGGETEFTRIVFDEGHHLFEAADSSFSGHLTGVEMAELRRWIRGPEERRRRGRALRERLTDLVEDIRDGSALLKAVEVAATCLPATGWRRRIAEGAPQGVAEIFLHLARAHVLARAPANRAGTEIEADCHPPDPSLVEAAERLEAELGELRAAMGRLAAALLRRLHEDAKELSSSERNRLESLGRSLRRRGELMLGGWRAMLRRLMAEAEEDVRDDRFVEWFSMQYAHGQEFDVGLHSHWIDPTVPLAECVLGVADTVVVTSATLRDRRTDMPDDWRSAEMRTGAMHLPWPVRRVSFRSPFDYARNARILLVNDVGREDMDQLAAAFRELFLAAGGGALGLFTAISRLRAVHGRIIGPLAQAGIPLYAQHVDPMDTGTLVDLFRQQEDSCLLGTDAVRDGVDVPGPPLRLMVMDRVPWPRPTILERARKKAFGGQAWTDMMVRLKLRQAFGRLIRTQSDRGVFVMLDSRLASRFLTAFPENAPVLRLGLAEAIRETARFLETGTD